MRLWRSSNPSLYFITSCPWKMYRRDDCYWRLGCLPATLGKRPGNSSRMMSNLRNPSQTLFLLMQKRTLLMGQPPTTHAACDSPLVVCVLQHRISWILRVGVVLAIGLLVIQIFTEYLDFLHYCMTKAGSGSSRSFSQL